MINSGGIMALLNTAVRDLVSYTPQTLTPDIICIHTIVGYWHAGRNAAHFTSDAGGTIRQHRDTKHRAAANLNGNWRVISFENEDHGPAYGSWNVNDGHAVPGFTAAQCEGLAKSIAELHRIHNIPLEMIPDTKPGRRGIAYHRQGIYSSNNYAGYAYKGIVPGGETWSNATGKVCPGDRRITQLINVILPRARVLAGLEVEEDLNESQASQLDWLYKRARGRDRQRWFRTDTNVRVGTILEVTEDPNVVAAAKYVWHAAQSLDELDLKYLVDQIAVLQKRPAADVDEAALAAELSKLDIGGSTAEEILAVLKAQLNK